MRVTTTAMIASRWTLPLIYGALVAILLSDMLTPLGFAHALLYAPIVCLMALYGRLRLLSIITAVTVIFTWVGVLLAPPPADSIAMAAVFYNRIASTFVLLIVAGLTFLTIRYQAALHTRLEQLHINQQQLAHTTQLAKISHWEYHRDSDKVHLSEEAASLIGFCSQRVIARKDFARRFFGDGRLMLEALARTTPRAGAQNYENQEVEAALVPDPKHKKYVRLLTYPVKENRVDGIIQDISEQKSIELKSLREMEKIRSINEGSPIFLWYADTEGNIVDANDYLDENMGPQADPKDNTLHRWLQLLHPEDQGMALTRWTKSVRTGQHYQLEYRLRHADGHYEWYTACARPRHDERGQICGWLGATVNINHLKASSPVLNSTKVSH